MHPFLKLKIMIPSMWWILIVFDFFVVHVSPWCRGTARHTSKLNHWIRRTDFTFMPSSAAAPRATVSAKNMKTRILKNYPFLKLKSWFQVCGQFCLCLTFLACTWAPGAAALLGIHQNWITGYVGLISHSCRAVPRHRAQRWAPTIWKSNFSKASFFEGQFPDSQLK